jgi:hypothetical protein
MLKKPITFTDFDGNKVTKEFWFHISKAELAEMHLLYPEGDLTAYLRELISSNDVKRQLEIVKQIIAMSVGERTSTGRFIKNDEIRQEFMSSDAYSELFMELIQDAQKTADFMNAVMPADLVAAVAEQQRQETDYTDEQLLAMDQEQFNAVAGTNPSEMTKRHLVIAMQRKTRQPA